MLQVCLQRIQASVPTLPPSQLRDLGQLIQEHGAWAVTGALGEALAQKRLDGESVDLLHAAALTTIMAEVQLLATAGMSHAQAA